MENTLDSEKLPDLVSSTSKQKTLSAITTTLSTVYEDVTSENANINSIDTSSLSGIPEQSCHDLVENQISFPVVMPVNAGDTEMTNTSIILEIPPTQLPSYETIGHDTATTTDEEEAADALIC